jgi:outer membrane biosynthesis protein TonB
MHQKITIKNTSDRVVGFVAPGQPRIQLSKGETHVFNSATLYAPFSKSIINLKDQGLVEVLVEDTSKPKPETVKPVEASKPVAKVEEPKPEPKKVEVKKPTPAKAKAEEPKPEVKD